MLSMTTLAETPEKSAVLSRSARIVILGLIHVVAIGVLLIYENGIVQIVAALLTWGLLNFFWLMLLRRPAVAALLSFGTVVALMVLSMFKHQFLSRTITFLDVIMVDTETTQFLFDVFPDIGWQLAGATTVFSVAARLDLVARSIAHAATGCAGGICAVLRSACGNVAVAPARSRR
jgi:hypothetical protein